MAREAVRLDASQRGKRDGILQAAYQPRRRAGQPGRDLTGGPAPIIVTASLGGPDLAYLDGLRRAHYPPERNLLPAHLTLFHHLPPSLERELAGRLAAFASAPPPRASLARLIDLGGGTAFGVESEVLENIRAELAVAFRGMLTPQDGAPWRPHVTIQNKVAPREAKRVQASLRATFRPRPLEITGLASWFYRGGPWEPIKACSFRG